MENTLLVPTVFLSVEDALKALSLAEYDCRSKFDRQVNLTYDWGSESWSVSLRGFRDDLLLSDTPLEACQDMYDYLVLLRVRKYLD